MPSSQPVACCVPFKYVIISFMCTLTPQHTHTLAKSQTCHVFLCGCCYPSVCLGLGYFYGMHEMLLKHLSPFAACLPTCSADETSYIRDPRRLADHISRPVGFEPKMLAGHCRFDACSPELLTLLAFFVAAFKPHGCKII